ncbi:hypothetical protein NCAST_32_06740 [Nocardia asteroides NBRC 15531]|uniref:Uncharacterized protein n=1 Tax=Nocardia asteroides NBRC 15531 TaxID=1110697 RepID=U5E841_NOCAS|nr:hypothetical protein NCAST_32_06740 [Nocardia asteroides NBRC 15531]
MVAQRAQLDPVVTISENHQPRIADDHSEAVAANRIQAWRTGRSAAGFELRVVPVDEEAGGNAEVGGYLGLFGGGEVYEGGACGVGLD